MHVIRQKMTFLDLAFLLLGQFPEYISQMPAVSTAGYVKLFVPPRQSRGNSYWGLAAMSELGQSRHFAETVGTSA